MKAYNIDEIIESINRVDKILRAYAIICPPFMKDTLEKELGEKYKIIANPCCPATTCYLINREDFEKYCGVSL